MKLGKHQQNAINFLLKTGKPSCFRYNNYENRRIVDSLEKRGLISVFRYPPNASAACLVTLIREQP